MAMSPYVRQLRDAIADELLLLPSVTGIIFDEEDRILLVRQMAGAIWSTPGGSIEPHESPADAVVREVWEETGLTTEPIRLLGAYGGRHCLVTYPNGDRTSYVMIVFECAVRGGVLQTRTDEISETAFVGRADLANIPTSPWVPHILPGLYDRTRTAHFEPPIWRPS